MAGTPKPKCETLKEFFKFRDFKVEERNQFSKRKLPQKQTSVTVPHFDFTYSLHITMVVVYIYILS